MEVKLISKTLSKENKMEKIKELLKLATDSMKNETLYKLLRNDMDYQKGKAEEQQALKAVNNLKLTKEQKNIINTLIARKDKLTYDVTINAYIAGMLDSYEILKMFNLTRE